MMKADDVNGAAAVDADVDGDLDDDRDDGDVILVMTAITTMMAGWLTGTIT